MLHTIAGQRWQRLQETLTEAGIPYTQYGSYSVALDHPNGRGAGILLIRVSHSKNFDVRTRSMGQELVLDGRQELWSTSQVFADLSATALEYLKTGGRL